MVTRDNYMIAEAKMSYGELVALTVPIQGIMEDSLGLLDDVHCGDMKQIGLWIPHVKIIHWFGAVCMILGRLSFPVDILHDSKFMCTHHEGFSRERRAKGSCCLGLPLGMWIKSRPMPSHRKKE